jgi:CO/xanthine dehydrogenase Mo-binding subunit
MQSTLSPLETSLATMREQTLQDLGNVVDELGLLKAQDADLVVQMDARKAGLIVAAAAMHLSAFEGLRYRATVSFADKRKTDWPAVVDALAKRYGIDPLEIARVTMKHTQTAEGVPTVRVTARKGV